MTTIDGKNLPKSKLTEQVPPQLWLVGSSIFHYLGPSFAVLLAARLPIGGVAWLRIASAAVVFAIWRRPWRSFVTESADTQRVIVGLGAVFAAMNYSFYVAIDRLPLGTVAAIEFVGPLMLALVGLRTRRNFLALGLAVLGVYLLVDARIAGDPVAFVWAGTNVVLFTLYIVLAHHIAQADSAASPIDRLGAAMIIASVVITPVGLGAALPAIADPRLLVAGIGVGLSSSVIPYVFDQLAMQRVARATYALFVALLPAMAVVVGAVVLGQIPQAVELFAVGLVIAGVLLHREADDSRQSSSGLAVSGDQ